MQKSYQIRDTKKMKPVLFFLRGGDKMRVDFSIREIRLSFWQINVKSNLPLNTTQKKLCSTFQKNILIRKKKSFPVWFQDCFCSGCRAFFLFPLSTQPPISLVKRICQRRAKAKVTPSQRKKKCRNRHFSRIFSPIFSRKNRLQAVSKLNVFVWSKKLPICFMHARSTEKNTKCHIFSKSKKNWNMTFVFCISFFGEPGFGGGGVRVNYIDKISFFPLFIREVTRCGGEKKVFFIQYHGV